MKSCGQGSGVAPTPSHDALYANPAPNCCHASGTVITGDSFIADVRPISQDDPVSGFIEVFKYAVKFPTRSLPTPCTPGKLCAENDSSPVLDAFGVSRCPTN